MIPKEKIEELREKADIVSVISEYVQLKKRGKNFLGLCPFHAEKTPSFTVSPEKQLFHCFGCGEGGNLFAFIMKMEKVDFPEAAQILGEKVGVHIEKTASDSVRSSYKERLFEVLFHACKFFESQLESREAGQYLAKRGIKPETAKKFRLGYAQENWDGLLKFLLNKGFKPEDIEAAGLILPRKEKEGYYDRFRSRLIFPILDLRGRVLGFSGRTLTGDEPKYMNSPDSAVFVKGDHLFGLFYAKEEIKKRKFAILVEGNVDVLSVFDGGFNNVVAPLGTALTMNQAKLLSRFAETVVIAFDSDPAGLTASERSQELLREAGIRVRIADLGKYKDPDEFIKNAGQQVFFEAIKNSRPALEFKITRILSRFNLKEIEPRAKAAYQVAELLSREKDPLVKNEYIKLAASLLRMDAELLTAEVNKRGAYFLRDSSRRTIEKPPDAVREAEKTLIRLALNSETALADIIEEVGSEELTDPGYKRILAELKAHPADQLPSSLNSPELDKMVREALVAEEPVGDEKRMIADCVKVIKQYHLKKQIEELRAELENAEKKGDFNSVSKLNAEYKNLSEISRSLVR